MFDFLRDGGTTAEDKRQESLSAYLDNTLTAADRERFERQLGNDPTLRAEMEQLRLLKSQLRAMPRRRVPRSFALDPAVYGRPKAQPWIQLYPVLRGATALTAFFLIFTLALGAFRGQFTGGEMAPTAAEIAVSDVPVEEVESFEMAGEDAPVEAPAAGVEDRVRPTTEPQAESFEAPAELEAPEALTMDATPPPVEGTPAAESNAELAGVPAAELAVEGTVAVAEPTLEAAAGELAQSAEDAVEENAAVMVSPDEAISVEAAEEASLKEGGGDSFASFLQPIQIALAIAFALSSILWLIARGRSRTF